VQESIRSIASMSDIDLVLPNGLTIDEVTKEAFNVLGANGIVRVADQHTCSECTQEYKATADIFPNSNSAATVGVDDENIVDVPTPQQDQSDAESNNEFMQVDNGVVQLIVLDGMVTGPSVCDLILDWNLKLI
jgi:hypothetical protein